MKKNIIIIILVITLVGYVIYDKINEVKNETNIKIDEETAGEENIVIDGKEEQLDNKEETIDNNDDNDSLNEINTIDLKIYENLITKDLSKLLSKNSLSELTNQDKLCMLFEIYKNKYGFPDSFTKSDLNNVYLNSVLRNLKFEHAKIHDYSIVNDYTGSLLFDYNDGIYQYSKTGHQYETVRIINKELIEKSQKDNEITLSYKFVFLKQTGTSPVYFKLYNTIDDIINNKEFKQYSYIAISDEASYNITLNEVKNYINNNYDSIKDNLKVYTYVFETRDNLILLKDFYTK